MLLRKVLLHVLLLLPRLQQPPLHLWRLPPLVVVTRPAVVQQLVL